MLEMKEKWMSRVEQLTLVQMTKQEQETRVSDCKTHASSYWHTLPHETNTNTDNYLIETQVSHRMFPVHRKISI